MCIGIPDEAGVYFHYIKYTYGNKAINAGINKEMTAIDGRKFKMLEYKIGKGKRPAN